MTTAPVTAMLKTEIVMIFGRMGQCLNQKIRFMMASVRNSRLQEERLQGCGRAARRNVAGNDRVHAAPGHG
jgi:hypothetical protein